MSRTVIGADNIHCPKVQEVDPIRDGTSRWFDGQVRVLMNIQTPHHKWGVESIVVVPG